MIQTTMANSGDYTDVFQTKCHTLIKKKKYDFTWRISQFSAWFKMIEGMQYSSSFPDDSTEKIKWQLCFDPKASQSEENCSVFLKLKSTNSRKEIPISYQLILMGSKNAVIHKVSFSSKIKAGSFKGYTKISIETLLQKVQPEDELQIECTIEAQTEIMTVPNKVLKLPVLTPSSLLMDLETLVGDEQFGDVTMVVNGEKVLAHKNILAARSPVFAAMFTLPMQEKAMSCVTITDVEPTVFKDMLRYIYTDRVTCLDKKAHELYAAADKYAISALKSLCRNNILEKLSLENAADTLKLADLHSDLEMKQYTLEFISGSVAGQLTKTAGWKNMASTHPHLIDEAFDALAARTLSP